MKKTLQTIGFLALLITATQGYTATEEVVTDPQTAARSVITSSFDDSTGLLRRKGLVIINDLWDRFQVTFHGDAYALVSVLKTLSTLSPGKIIEAAFSAQDARNAEATAKAEAAAVAGRQRTLAGLGSPFKGLGLDKVSACAEDLDSDLRVKSAAVARIQGDIASTTSALEALNRQKEAYGEANDLVSNVVKWGKSHQLDADIIDPIEAADAWVKRRQTRFASDQRNTDKKEKLALAQSVLKLVMDSATTEAMATKTSAYEAQISAATSRLSTLRDDLKIAKKELKDAEGLSASAASRVKALTPKGTPTSVGGGGGEGFATPTGRK